MSLVALIGMPQAEAVSVSFLLMKNKARKMVSVVSMVRLSKEKVEVILTGGVISPRRNWIGIGFSLSIPAEWVLKHPPASLPPSWDLDLQGRVIRSH